MDLRTPISFDYSNILAVIAACNEKKHKNIKIAITTSKTKFNRLRAFSLSSIIEYWSMTVISALLTAFVSSVTI